MEVVLPIAPDALLEVTKDWFVTELGFALLSIVPADAPREAVLQGHGLRLRLRKLESAAPPGAAAAVLRLTTAAAGVGGAPRTLTAPNGSVVEVVAKLEPPLPLPPLQEALFICREREENAGRAGMLYRDLIPNRLGGRFIASHIRIPDAGPVPDMLHFHVCRFQLIFCVRGSVLLVYEDQGQPFWLRAGDCVLQPPGIRHKVLETPQGGVEVLEVGSPAEHLTVQDLEMTLPTQTVDAERQWAQEYDGAPQKFVRHNAAAEAVVWSPHPGLAGWEFRDSGIAAATKQLGSCIVSRQKTGGEAEEDAAGAAGDGAAGAAEPVMLKHDGELVLWFVLRGECTLQLQLQQQQQEQEQAQGAAAVAEVLRESESIVLPAGCGVAVAKSSAEFEMVEVLVGTAGADVQWSIIS